MIELNKIYNENNCETMKRIPDNFVDLTVTSPPYDNLRDYNGYSFDFERIALELYRITKEGGIVAWVVNDAMVDGSESLTSCKQKIYFRENCGFNIHDTMIYEKNGPAYPDQTRYYQIFEYMFILSKGKPKTFNPIKDRKNRWYGLKFSKTRTRRGVNGELTVQDWYKDEGEQYGTRFNIWKYNVGAGYSTSDKLAHEHPAIFPEKLAQDHIITWSNEQEIIYDPFMGSGTVAKMCIKTNRNYVGSEISKEYCTLAEKRLKPYKQEIDMFHQVS